MDIDSREARMRIREANTSRRGRDLTWTLIRAKCECANAYSRREFCKVESPIPSYNCRTSLGIPTRRHLVVPGLRYLAGAGFSSVNSTISPDNLRPGYTCQCRNSYQLVQSWESKNCGKAIAVLASTTTTSSATVVPKNTLPVLNTNGIRVRDGYSSSSTSITTNTMGTDSRRVLYAAARKC
eukprot:828954-Rhodomonas_salina.1